jgi:hypothetical protein
MPEIDRGSTVFFLELAMQEAVDLSKDRLENERINNINNTEWKGNTDTIIKVRIPYCILKSFKVCA